MDKTGLQPDDRPAARLAEGSRRLTRRARRRLVSTPLILSLDQMLLPRHFCGQLRGIGTRTLAGMGVAGQRLGAAGSQKLHNLRKLRREVIAMGSPSLRSELFTVRRTRTAATRVPDALPLDSSGRRQLESVLQRQDLAIVPTANSPAAERGTRRLRADLAALVDDADPGELDRLEEAVTAAAEDGLDARFFGPAPDAVTAATAVVTDLSEQFAQRRRLAAQALTREQAADLLGISAQSVTIRLEAGKLVGIKVGRAWRLPRWQFDPDNTDGALPGLDELQAAFPGGPVSLSAWMTRPLAEFDGRTPREEMIRLGSAAVTAHARRLTAAGW
jgi:excisionase family DNA binding protein